MALIQILTCEIHVEKHVKATDTICSNCNCIDSYNECFTKHLHLQLQDFYEVGAKSGSKCSKFN